jgi:VIT1/CCC1 family predicted Fe2+/Mn2+ transporter
VSLRKLREAKDPQAAHGVIRDAVPPLIGRVLHEPELEAMRGRLSELDGVPQTPGATKDDFRAAFGVFLLVFLSTFPVVIPFIVMSDATRALRVSNGIAIAMLFIIGHRLGRYMGHRAWQWGMGMVLIGIALVGITIALGG